MSNKELTKLALKVFSIYVMVQAILAIPQFFQVYLMLKNGTGHDNAGWFIAISAASVVLLVMLSVFIWKLSVNISTQLITESTSSSSNVSESFILSVLGFYLVVYGLTRVSVTSTSTYYLLQTTSDVNLSIAQNIVYLIVYVVVAILGLSLVIKTNGWVRLLNKLRVAGT